MDIVKYGMQLAKNGASAYFESATSNLRDIRDNVKIVRSVLSENSNASKEEFNKIKNGDIVSSIKSWFYSEAEDLDYDDSSDFDPGYNDKNTDSMEDEPAVETSVSPEAFANISGKQTASLYRIAAKQADISVLSTAEISSSIKRSNETTIASINKMTEAIGATNQRLDVIIQSLGMTNELIKSSTPTAPSSSIKNPYENGAYKNGTVDIESLMKIGKSNKFGMDGISGYLDMVKMFKPSDAVSIGIEKLLDTIKPGGIFGNNSIHQGITKTDEFVGSFAESLMSELTSSKIFKKVFGDVNSFTGDKDYAKSVNNQYNTKPAVFDGMVRTSIVDVIPTLLRTLHKDLSDEETHVDNHGQVKSGKEKNYFKDVTKDAFNSSSLLSMDTLSEYTNVAKGANLNISSADMNNAAKVLSMVYVMELHRTGKNLLDSQLVNDGMKLSNKVVNILVQTTGKSEVFWSDVVLTLITQLQTNPVDAHKFVKAVNTNLANMISSAETFAQTSTHAKQSSTLNLSDAVETFQNDYKRMNPNAVPSTQTTTTANNTNDNNTNNQQITPVVERADKYRFTTSDYVRGIFGILNRGINVRVMESTKPYRPYRIHTQSPENPPTETVEKNKQNNDAKETDNTTDIGEAGNTKSYIDKILDSVVPKSIRISMQRFGENAQNASDRLGLTETGEDGKKHLISKDVRDSINQFMSPLKNKVNKIGDLLLGEKEEIENEDGTKTTKRTGGTIRGIGNVFKNELSNIKNDVGSAVSSRIEQANYNQLKNNVKRMDVSDDTSRNDQLLAQQAFALMETAMSDGDGSSTDISAILEIVNQIKNDTLKSNITRSINKMIKPRVGDNKSTSKLGGIMGTVISTLGKLFSPIRLVLSGIKTVVGKIFNFYMKFFKSGMTHLYTGIKSIGQGLFGSKQDGEDGLIKKLISKPLSLLSKGFDKIKTIGSSIIKKFTGFFDKFKSSNGTSSTPTADGSDEAQPKTGAFGKLGDKIRSSEFGKGFMQSFDEAVQIKSRNKATASTKSDWYTGDILSVLQDRGSVATNTVFDKIISKLEEVNKSVVRVDNSVDAFKNAYRTEEATDDATSAATNATGNISSGVSNVATVSATAGRAAGTAAATGGSTAMSAGKLVGGVGAVIMALVEILAPIVLAMKGVQTILDGVKNLLSAIIKPLEPVIKVLGNMLEPILKTLGEMLEPVMVAVGGVIEVLLPILNVLSPVLDALGPVLNIITSSLVNATKYLLTPIMEAVVSTIVPVLNVVSGAIQVILGVVQSIWGVLNYGLGQLIYGVGKLTLSQTLTDFGKDMVKSGSNNMESGAQSMKDGWHLLTHPTVTEKDEEKDDTDIKLVHDEYKNVSSTGSALDGVVGSGDVYDSHNSSVINNYYGSGDQSSYGSYLNMGQRGCGPLALADNISRRTGARVNPRDLASGMYSSGSYEPHRGTSVSGYINTSSALGVNLRPGGVTNTSLRHASPNNPVTLIGSGIGYGTRTGNNHFINALGTTGSGQTIVSNPLTGKVGRVSTNSLVAHTRLGLYGSGDEDSSDDSGIYDSLGFSDETKEAVKKLTSITSKIVSIFDFGDSDEKESLNQAKADATANRLEQVMGENAETYEKIARANFEKDYAKKSGESDAEYNARWNKVRIKYLSEAVNAYDSLTVAKYGAGTITPDEMKSRSENLSSDSLVDKLGKILTGLDAEDVASASSSNPYTANLGGHFASSKGVELATQKYSPTIYANNLTSNSSTESPLHEFFAKTTGDGVTSSTSWYDHYNSPTGVDGVGTSGGTHQGVDINTPHDATGTVPIYPTCDGKVTIARYSPSAGNYVAWEDKAGYRHRIMHMNKRPDVAVGEQLIGGATRIGYVGNTGASSGAHIHYDIYADGGSGGRVNPFTYFNYIQPQSSSSSGTMSGDNITEKIYSYLTTAGMSGIGASGLMGCFKYESGYDPGNLEDSYQKRWGYTGSDGDARYTNAVNSGVETESQFVNSRGSGKAGYGIAQFTSSNLKQDLYDKTVKRGLPINDLGTQLGSIIDILKQRNYNGNTLYNSINTSPTPTTANQKFLWRYEAGTGYNSDQSVAAAYPWMGMAGINKRHQEAENMYNLYKNKNYKQSSSSSTPTYYPPTTNSAPSVYPSTSSGSTSQNNQGGSYNGQMSLPNTPWFENHENDFNLYKSNPGLKSTFMPAALSSNLTYPEMALIMSTGIWEDGGKKLFGTKSLTDKTHDSNGQQATGIMNWVDDSVVRENPTMAGQLNYIKQSYFADKPTHNRAYIQKNIYDGQKNGYTNATGWGFSDKPGERYAPTLNSGTTQGLIEGTTHFMGNALVPACRNSEDGIAKHAAVAVEAYNWLNEQGYTSKSNKNRNATAMKQAFSSFRGSGDADVYRDYDIPEIDVHQLLGNESSPTIQQSQNPVIIQNYKDTQEENTRVSQQRYETILSNTYNVRAKEIEILVTEIRDMLKSKNNNNNNTNPSVVKNVKQNNDNDLFSNNQIPNAITRLMRG